MLAPSVRSTVFDAVRPPAGMELAEAVLCTYSADLRTLVAIPALLAADLIDAGDIDGAGAPVGHRDFAALRRMAGRISVFSQQSALLAAGRLPPVVSELETVVHEVAAPHGGAFHPKLWLLEFAGPNRKRAWRLVVGSRNLTPDRSWDMAVTLDGREGTASDTFADLAHLLRSLPDLCVRRPPELAINRLHALAGRLKNVIWSPPAGVRDMHLRVLGLGPSVPWRPPPNERLVVLSPFLDGRTLEHLAATSEQASLLVSRPDALDRCKSSAARFGRRAVLATAQAEADAPPGGELHAKIVIWQAGRRCRAVVGSMNATSAATQASSGHRNVEAIVDFDCTTLLAPDGLDAVIGRKGLGSVLADYEPVEPAAPPPPDTRAARRDLASCDLFLSCVSEVDGVRVTLNANSPLPASAFASLPNLRFRLATQEGTDAQPCGEALAAGEAAPLPRLVPLERVTGFVVFEAEVGGAAERFTLNLRLEGIDSEARDAAILKALLPTPSAFIDFVRVLLGDNTSLEAGGGWMSATGDPGERPWMDGDDVPSAGLLELLVRCAADDPNRLTPLAQILNSIGEEQVGRLAPDGFLPIWEALRPLAGGAR